MEEKIKIIQKCLLFYKNKILILQREPNDSLPNKWDLPGGNLKFLEKMEDAIIREVKEETSLSIKKVERIGMQEELLKDKRKHFLLILYKTKISSSNIKLSKEHQNCQWIKPSDFFKVDFSPLFKNCKEIIK